MPSNSKSDTPAAKVVMKVPTPDSLVEVRVSPPDSNFEVKVAPGEDVIELHIRPGSSSFVEVRISPPGNSRTLDGLGRTSNISMVGGATIYQTAVETEAPKLPASNMGETAAPEADEILVGEIEEKTAAPQEDDPAPPPADSGGRANAIPPDVTSFSEGVFIKLDDETGGSPAGSRLKEDSSGIPGPDPALFENSIPSDTYEEADQDQPAEEEYYPQQFLDPEPEENATEYWPPESEKLNPVSSAARMALARLSAAVEKEKAEMAANPAVLNSSVSPPPTAALDDEELTDLNNLADSALKSSPEENKAENGSRPENEYGRARKLAAADTTVMVQMYEDMSSFNSAADTATPLSEDEEMEIGPMDEELSLGSIDMDGLEDLDLEKSPPPRKARDRSVPRAKALSTVVPGNTIIPK